MQDFDKANWLRTYQTHFTTLERLDEIQSSAIRLLSKSKTQQSEMPFFQRGLARLLNRSSRARLNDSIESAIKDIAAEEHRFACATLRAFSCAIPLSEAMRFRLRNLCKLDERKTQADDLLPLARQAMDDMSKVVSAHDSMLHGPDASAAHSLLGIAYALAPASAVIRYTRQLHTQSGALCESLERVRCVGQSVDKTDFTIHPREICTLKDWRTTQDYAIFINAPRMLPPLSETLALVACKVEADQDRLTKMLDQERMKGLADMKASVAKAELDPDVRRTLTGALCAVKPDQLFSRKTITHVLPSLIAP